MTRRDASAIPRGGTFTMSDIGYINPDARGPGLHPIRGTWQTGMVPDTVDLADMAALAIRGLTGPTNPEMDYEVYWKVKFRYNPPVMHHEAPDPGIMAKFMLAMPLMRLMSGSEERTEVEKVWQDVYFKSTGPNGLIHTPLGGRPWGHYLVDEGFDFTRDLEEHTIEPQYNGYVIAYYCAMHRLTGDPMWQERAERIVDHITQYMMQISPEEACFPVIGFGYREKVDASWPEPVGMATNYQSWLVFGLNACYRAFGYDPARDLAGRLLRYSIRGNRYFDADANFLCDVPDTTPDHPRHGTVHFHNHTITVLHGLDYALLTGDQEILDFALKGYARALSYGNETLGWYPERVQGPCYPAAAELCCVADMIMMSAKIATAGIDNRLWDVADKAIRNQLAEGQIRRVDWVARHNMGQPPSAPVFDAEANASKGRGEADPMSYSFDRVMERNVGAFIGWAGVNEQVLWQRERQLWRGIMHCCTGNATRSLYVAWKYMVQEHAGGVTHVHLLMNRAGDVVDINSHIPYTGRVDFKVRKATALKIRLPEWVDTADVRLERSGQASNPAGFDGRYVETGNVEEGTTVTLSFPIAEETKQAVIERDTYYAVCKGNDVVEIDPGGRIAPMYRREHYRENRTRWVEKARFVTSERLPEI
ncbi:MAG: hypothetical protein CMJ18_07245 [Phycisphaeraceae bacterium]|nr:hypothetical protein [Phycisphaeraceae bacterium]